MFFFNDTATPGIYPRSLHGALPILAVAMRGAQAGPDRTPPTGTLAITPPGPWVNRLSVTLRLNARDNTGGAGMAGGRMFVDRKSTRLNSSHANISYAVFCLKKKTMT